MVTGGRIIPFQYTFRVAGEELRFYQVYVNEPLVGCLSMHLLCTRDGQR